MSRSTALRVIGLVALCGAAVALFVFLPVKERLAAFLEWVRGLGPWGPVALGAAYIPACLLFVPGSLLTLAAGFLFGVVWGTIAVSLGSTLGASAAFLAGRTLLRGVVEDRVARNPEFRAIDQAVAAQGAKIVLLTRLSPVFPFNLLNYAFGLTKVRFRDYVLASWIGMLPGTVMYVYLGSTARTLADVMSGNVAGGTIQRILFFLGLVASVVVAVLVTRIARASLARSIPSPNDPPSTSAE